MPLYSINGIHSLVSTCVVFGMQQAKTHRSAVPWDFSALVQQDSTEILPSLCRHTGDFHSPLFAGIPGSDYINANYIDGYRKQNAYIATQGALPETFGDFWRMMWEQQGATVVMMTKLEERSRVRKNNIRLIILFLKYHCCQIFCFFHVCSSAFFICVKTDFFF